MLCGILFSAYAWRADDKSQRAQFPSDQDSMSIFSSSLPHLSCSTKCRMVHSVSNPSTMVMEKNYHSAAPHFSSECGHLLTWTQLDTTPYGTSGSLMNHADSSPPSLVWINPDSCSLSMVIKKSAWLWRIELVSHSNWIELCPG